MLEENFEFEKPRRIGAAEKAYNNRDFIHSRDGRTIRILSEYLYPERHFKKNKIKRTVVFYGSARSLSKESYELKLKQLNDDLANCKEDHKKNDIEKEIKFLEHQEDITKSYEDCIELSKMLAEWGETLPDNKKFIITSGGGPGMMEAANRGAARAGIRSMGLNISLPFEQEPNHYISPDLNFEFHYFFMRKFWFVYLAQAFIAMPGGFGTLDELMEILTLLQTKKVTKKIPMVLYNEDFWKNLINFDFLLEKGMISKNDLKLFRYYSEPKEAFEFLQAELSKILKLK